MLSQNQDGGEIARALVRAEKQGFGSSHRFFSSYAAKEKEVLTPDATTPHLQKGKCQIVGLIVFCNLPHQSTHCSSLFCLFVCGSGYVAGAFTIRDLRDTMHFE